MNGNGVGGGIKEFSQSSDVCGRMVPVHSNKNDGGRKNETDKRKQENENNGENKNRKNGRMRKMGKRGKRE